MKKLLLSAGLLLSSAAIFAQTGVQSAPVPKASAVVAPKQNMPQFNNENSNDFRKAISKKFSEVEGWYQPLEIVKETAVGAGLEGPASGWMSLDSNFRILYSGGENRAAGFQSFGQVLDPKDELMDLSDEHAGLLLDRWSDYTVDSIGFNYLYIRSVDSSDNDQNGINEEVIDTVFIAYFSNAQIDKLEFTSSKDKLALVDWNTANRFPSGYLRLDTILLGIDRSNSPIDTTRVEGTTIYSAFTTISTKIPISVTKTNLVAFTVTFKSGVPAIIGADTAVMLDWRETPTTTPRRANAFGTFYYYNESTSGNEYTNKDYYNTPLLQPTWNAYGQVENFRDRYVPGFGAFVNDIFTSTAFYCKSLNASVKENELVNISSIFPNPASNSTTVNFDLKKSGTVKVNIVNLVGQEVANVDAGFLSAGANSLSFDVNTLKAGVYFVNINIDGVSTTKKLTIGQ